MKTAAIILTRNLPDVAESLREQILSAEAEIVDVFIVESGTDPDKLSPNYNFYADWPDAVKYGLRYPNGMNYGIHSILKLYPEMYDSFLLLANDTIIESSNPVAKLRADLFNTPKCGLVSPCGADWGEIHLLNDGPKAFWHIHNNCYFIDAKLVNCINYDPTTYPNTLFDSSNFRGYLSETELIAKSYINGFQAVITPNVLIREDESLLKERFSLIKTDPQSINDRLYIEEGLEWIKRKYSFSSRWDMNNFALNSYNQFFDWYPSLEYTYSIL